MTYLQSSHVGVKTENTTFLSNSKKKIPVVTLLQGGNGAFWWWSWSDEESTVSRLENGRTDQDAAKAATTGMAVGLL